MGKWIHFLIVLLLASLMTTYLYAYKPREYNTLELVSDFIVNLSFWTVIIGVAYMTAGAIVSFVKQYLFK
jgi:hypothetical protein